MSLSDQRLPPTKEVVTVEAPPELASHDGHYKPTWTAVRKVFEFFSYVPQRCRYDPEKPFEFSMGLNVLFGRQRTPLPQENLQADSIVL
jgi:hypothetical protein